jgi:hypothetical protein
MSAPVTSCQKACSLHRESRPNPSIERTATGLAREAPQVIVPLRGPIRQPPLMSNVRPHREANLTERSASGDWLKCKYNVRLVAAVSVWLVQ